MVKPFDWRIPCAQIFNVKLDEHTPCLYNVPNKNEEQTIWDKF
jgi:hypothetical protein